MSATKTYAVKSFLVAVLFMAAIGGAVSAGIYVGLKKMALVFASGSDVIINIPGINEAVPVQNLSDVAHLLDMLATEYIAGIVLFIVLVFLCFGLILWFVLKLCVSSKSSAAVSAQGKAHEADERTKKKDHLDKRLEKERRKRLFLHFISVLQRDGRLLDFFAEDLSVYDDEQIGAAVRSIQEDCRKSVDKYLAAVPVIDKQEGEVVDVEPGFDPDAIKLTGNVSGEPPFKGVLRHRGWKAANNEIPKLSDVQDASIIAPAEVEVE